MDLKHEKLIIAVFISFILISSGCASLRERLSVVINPIKDFFESLGLESIIPAIPKTKTVEIGDKGFKESDDRISIDLGDSIVFKNVGSLSHNIKIKEMDVNENLDQGEKVEINFNKEGSFTVKDDLRGYTIIVEVARG